MTHRKVILIFPNRLVLLADQRLPARSKPGGRCTIDGLDQVKRLRAALAKLSGRNFT